MNFHINCIQFSIAKDAQKSDIYKKVSIATIYILLELYLFNF